LQKVDQTEKYNVLNSVFVVLIEGLQTVYYEKNKKLIKRTLQFYVPYDYQPYIDIVQAMRY
jgi:hypothetical protein